MSTNPRTGTPAFIDDPMASVSAQFALAAPRSTPPSTDMPSPAGLRPWGLRSLRTSNGPPVALPEGRYSGELQMLVDRGGAPLIVADAKAPPSAKTTATVDGEDGPSAEDWDNDYCIDEPYQP